MALNAVKFLGWLKKFGPAQNILGPVKEQGITQNVQKKIPKYEVNLASHSSHLEILFMSSSDRIFFCETGFV